MRQPPESAETGAALGRLVEAEAGQDRGGAGFRRVGIDVGEAGVDLGDAVRVEGQFRLGHQGGPLAVGGEHDIDERGRA